MRYTLLTLVALLALSAGKVLPGAARAAQTAELKTITLAVKNMTCALCPFTVRKSLEAVPGVVDAKADYGTKTATVTFDPNTASVDALTKATTNAGFPSTVKDE